MSHDYLTLKELTARLGREPRIIEKLVQKGVIPGQRIAGEWRFHETEITHWLEQDLRNMMEDELAVVEARHTSDSEVGSPVSRYLEIETCEANLDAGTRPSVLTELLNVAGRTWHVWDTQALLSAIRDREDVMSTAFENGVAVPHPRNPLPGALGQTVIAFGRTHSGIPFGGPGRSLTDLFFLVLAQDAHTHLRILSRLARLLQQPNFVSTLRSIEQSPAAWEFIQNSDALLSAE